MESDKKLSKMALHDLTSKSAHRFMCEFYIMGKRYIDSFLVQKVGPIKKTLHGLSDLRIDFVSVIYPDGTQSNQKLIEFANIFFLASGSSYIKILHLDEIGREISSQEIYFRNLELELGELSYDSNDFVIDTIVFKELSLSK